MERGQVGGLNYAIPQTFVGDQQPATQKQDAVGEAVAAAQAQSPFPPDHPLAERGRMTSDYYDTYGRLKAYVTSMAKKGIDPTLPDYSQPGGGAAFQTYQMLNAGLMHTANTLGNELKAEQDLRVPMAEGRVERKTGIDYSTPWAQNAENVFSTKLSEAAQASLKAKEKPYTDRESIAQIKAYDDAELAKLEARKNEIDPKIYEREKAAFERGAIFEKQQFAPQVDYEAREKAKLAKLYAGEVLRLKQQTNLITGKWDEKVTFTKLEPDGIKYIINPTGKDSYWGKAPSGGYDDDGNPVYVDKYLKYYRMDPKTKKVYMVWNNPAIKPTEVTNMPASDLLLDNVKANNGDYNKMYAAIDYAKVYDDYGSSDNASPAFAVNNADANQDRMTKPFVKQQTARQSRIDADKRSLEQLEDTGMFTEQPGVGFDLPDNPVKGKKAVVRKVEDKNNQYFIDNADEFSDLILEDGTAPNKKTILNWDQVLAFLSAAGRYPDQQQTNASAPPQNETPEQRRIRLTSE